MQIGHSTDFFIVVLHTSSLYTGTILCVTGAVRLAFQKWETWHWRRARGDGGHRMLLGRSTAVVGDAAVARAARAARAIGIDAAYLRRARLTPRSAACEKAKLGYLAQN